MKKTGNGNSCFSPIKVSVVSLFAGGLLLCTSACTNARARTMETPNFTLKPPAEQNISMLLPDAEIQEKIIGSWEAVYRIYFYREVYGADHKAISKKNTISSEMRMIRNFSKDGSMTGSFALQSPMNTATSSYSRNSKHEVPLKGRWKCENGVITLFEANQSDGKEIQSEIIPVFIDENTMILHICEESERKKCRENIGKVLNAINSTIKRYDFYYDEDGNNYHVIEMEQSNSGEKTVNTYVCTKQVFRKIR